MPRIIRAWAARLTALAGIGRRRDDFDAELQSHLQLHIDDGLRAGLSPEEARRAALIKLGSLVAVREAYLDQTGVPALRILGDAARHGLRALVRHRAFNLTVVAILSLGVGSTAAMVSLVDALLFRPPAHVQAPDQLVHVLSAGNYPQYEELVLRSRTLDATAFSRRTLTLGSGEAAAAIETQCVTASYFPVLGATPVAGRGFAAADDVRGAPPTVVLGHGLWRRHYGGDPSVVGRLAAIAGIAHQIIGVAPPDFRGLEMAPVDAWILLAVTPEVCSLSGRNDLAASSGSWLKVVGRLRPGRDLGQAEREVRSLALFAMRLGGAPPPRELSLIADSRRNSASRDGRLSVWLVAGAGLVLLIACANVAGLLSVRAIQRRREIAVRLQLGASRGRVFLQLLSENVALSGACAIGAWLVAGWIGGLLQRYFPAVLHDQWFDPRSMAVLVAFALGATVLAGVVPSAQTSRAGGFGHWRSGATLGQATPWFLNALLTAQIALALVLGVGAALFARSVGEIKSRVGYDLDRVVVAAIDLDRAGIRRQVEKRLVFDRLLEAVRRISAVDAVALSTAAPLGSGQSYAVMPGPPGTAGGLTRQIVVVTPDYFRTLGTRIVEGRAFTEADVTGSRAVAILDSGLAGEMWPGERVVGQCREIAPGRPCVEIAGLSEPRRIGSLTRPGGEIFYPLGQSATSTPQVVLVRPRGPAAEILPAVRAAIRGAAPNLPFVNVRTLEDIADVQARSWRLGATLFGLFGAAAVVLAAVGVYAALAFAVRQRTAEIGVRLTLGARPSAIGGMVLAQGLRLIAIGWAIGLVASRVLGYGIATLLFGVVPTDVTAFAAASAIVAAAALAGCLLPAIRAARVDPAIALRTE
jgi:putative ABC transport system permease protein